MKLNKPSESPPKLLKTNNSIALRTSFQALLYWHVDMKKNRNHENCIVDSQVAEIIAENDNRFANEIVENGEQVWLEDFRWYRDKLEVAKAPKSSILCLLFCIEGFIRCHWEVAYKVIQTKRNTENFLDEYGTRWVSYSDLIMTMEEEFHFVETAINNIYDNDQIEKEKQLNNEFIPKYSFLRMMCRIWGKYVMKKLLPDFIKKIREVMSVYHTKVKSLAMEYNQIMKKKFARTSLKNKWSIDQVTRDLLLQSVQMIVDISLNEISINYLDSTCVQLGIFYPQVEEVVLNEWSDLYDEMKEYVDPYGFQNLSQIHYNEVKNVFPKTTQRKLHELMSAKQVSHCETKIKRYYHEFLNIGSDGKSDSLEMLKKKSAINNPYGNFNSENLKHILGNHEKERITDFLKSLVVDWQSGSGLFEHKLSYENSISDDEEVKDWFDSYQVRIHNSVLETWSIPTSCTAYHCFKKHLSTIISFLILFCIGALHQPSGAFW